MHGRRLPSIMLYDHAGAFWRKGGTPGSWAQPEKSLFRLELTYILSMFLLQRQFPKLLSDKTL